MMIDEKPVLADDAVRSARHAIENPHRSAVLLVGAPGGGKSFALAELLHGVRGSSPADSARSATLIRPTKATTDVALAALVDTVSTVRLPARRAGATPAVRSDGRSEAPLLAIDDCDLLDPSSLLLLSQLLDQRTLRLVCATSERHTPRILRFLRPVRSVAIVTLPPWSAHDVVRLMRTQFGGVMHELALKRLLTFSGGNPLCVTELIDTGARSAVLRRRHEVWDWEGPLTVPPLTMARMEGALDGLDAVLRDVLASVALAGTVELRVLERMYGLAAVEAADEAGLLTVTQGSGEWAATPRVPIQARVVLQGLSTVRRRRIGRELADAAADRLRGPERARILVQLVDKVAVDIEPAGRIQLAEAALRLHSARLSELILRSAPRNEPRVASLRATALMAQGRSAEAEAVLTDHLALVSAAQPPPQPPDGQQLDGQQLDGQQLDGQQFMARAMTTASGVDWAEPPDRAPPDDGYREAAYAWTGARLSDVLDAATPILDRRDWDHPASQRMLAAVVAAQLQLGRLDAATGSNIAVDDVADASFDPFQRVHLQTLWGLCHLNAGRIAAAETAAAALRSAGLAEEWRYPYGCGAALAGLAALAGARPARAALMLSESVSTTSDTASVAGRRYLLAQLAVAYAMAGRQSDARAALRDADADGAAHTPRILQEKTELARAEVMLTAGMEHSAHEVALTVATRCERGQQQLAALLALHLCARTFPSAGISARLATVAEGMDFALADTYVDHAAAAAARDGEGLSRVADAYARSGLRWLSGETAARSLALVNGAQAPPWAAGPRRILIDLRGSSELRLPASWDVDRHVLRALTAREREIAEMVATGRTSREIADRLNVSQRTVENHLQRVFGKLGVNRREHLATAFGREE